MDCIENENIHDIINKAKAYVFIEDYKSACKCYEEAAFKGERESFNKLITYYYKERYNRDLRRAAFWLEKYLLYFPDTVAVKAKYEYRLGFCLSTLYLKEKQAEDKDKAIVFLNLAYKDLTEISDIRFLKRYITRIGIFLYRLGEYDQSFAVFETIYNNFPFDSCPIREVLFYLGKCYLFGKGVKKDPNKAFDLLQNSAKLNYSPAQSLLSKFFGGDISSDMKK